MSAGIQVSFESLAPLEFSGTAVSVGVSGGPPFKATYTLGQGQSLQVKQGAGSSDRCELKPVIGTALNGVARAVWTFKDGTVEPIVFANIVRAEAE